MHLLLSKIRLLHRLGHPLRPPQRNGHPTHPQRQHDRQRPGRDPQHKHPLHRHHNRPQHSPLQTRVQGPQERAPDPRDGRLDVRPGDAGQQGRDAVFGQVEEDGVGDGEGDGDAGDLGAGDEADGEGDFLGRDEPLRDGEGGVDEGPRAQPAEGERGVDVGGPRGQGDVEEHGVADNDEEAAGQEPREVVPEFLHQGPVEHRAEDQGDDVREEADAGAQSVVRLDELEVDWDEVDGDEGIGGGGGDLGKEDGHFFVGDVVDGEDAAGKRRQDGEGLLEGEQDEEDAGEDEERDDGRAVPSVEDAAKGDGHDAGDKSANLEERAEIVDFTAAGEQGGAGAGVARWEVEKVDGSEGGPNAEVDVKGPAPGGAAVGEGAADDGTETAWNDSAIIV